MPVRPLRPKDLQQVPPMPRLHAVPVPPPLPRRSRPAPPSIPAAIAINRKAVAAAGTAALLLVSSVLVWAAKHPSSRSRALSVPTLMLVADLASPTPTPTHPVAEPVIPSTPALPIATIPEPRLEITELNEPAAAPRVEAPGPEAPVTEVAAACDTFGTSVEFDPNPARAAQQAAKTQKLLMVLHVSGNFEDAAFT